MESRLTELEIKAAFSEDLLEELNRSVYRQQQQIEQLQQEVRLLRQQLLVAIPADQRDLRDEVPPHY